MRTMCLLLFSLSAFAIMAQSSPGERLTFERTITVRDAHPDLALDVPDTLPTGALIPFVLRNTSSETLTIKRWCSPVVLLDDKDLLLDTNHHAQLKKVTYEPIDLTPGASTEVCRWDGLTSYENDTGLHRAPLAAGHYKFVLRGSVEKDGKTVYDGEVGGHLVAPFELVEPKKLKLGPDTETMIDEKGFVQTDDGSLTLQNLSVTYAHLEGGGNLSGVKLRIFHNGDVSDVHIMRDHADPNSGREKVGTFTLQLTDVDAYGPGWAKVIVTN